MWYPLFLAFVSLLTGGLLGCAPAETVVETPVDKPAEAPPLTVGAERLDLYLPLLRDRRVGLVVNQSSRVGERHLVDVLLENGIAVQRIFSPEHGFRGTADAGEKVDSGTDARTGLPIVSLYGKNRRPTAAQYAGLDYLVFDIQDVGARFYTYISTLHYVLDLAAELRIPVLVLDRPNPNGHYVDGPVLDPAFRSFVGMHPVPVVHGMTVGEYAQLINGEGWLTDGRQVALTVIPVANYTHQTPYSLPVAPSPNLPNDRAIQLYPSLCLLEPTNVSVGRGTDKQFQVLGARALTPPKFSYRFIPKPGPGAKHPKLEGEVLYGRDYTTVPVAELRAHARLDLDYLLTFYAAYPDKADFFTNAAFFDKLAGNATLRQQLISGVSEAEIRASWEPALSAFKATRRRYLLYPK